MRDTTSIVFTGDIAFTKYFGALTDEHRVLSDRVGEYLRSADYCVGNIEGPIMTRDADNTREFNHCSTPLCVDVLDQAHINIWNLANNHMLDFGERGLRSTQELAAAHQCATIGAGMDADAAAEPVWIDAAGGIGIFAVSYTPKYPEDGTAGACLHWDDLTRIQNTVARIKETCRWCIMVVHGGDEFASMPMPDVRQRYLGYLELGVDILVGHHPHVVQNYETVGEKVIFYSLGNFIFDTDYQRAQLHTELGMLMKLSLNENGFTWDSLPVRICRENHRVEVCDAPAIFTEIGPADYQKLWPLAARDFLMTVRKMRRYLQPQKYGKFNGLLWQLKEIYGCRRSRDRMLYLARLRAYFKAPKQVDAKVVNYLREN